MSDTEYDYEVHGNYGTGWELETTGDDKAQAEQLLADYRRNVPDVPHKLVKVRR